MGSFDHISDDDPRVIEHAERQRQPTSEETYLRAENLYLQQRLEFVIKPDTDELRRQNDIIKKLEAELEALKPEPKIETVFGRAYYREGQEWYEVNMSPDGYEVTVSPEGHKRVFDNLKLTFKNKILIGAEIIQEDGGRK